MPSCTRPSVTPDDAGCQELLKGELARLGFRFETIARNGVTNLWALRRDQDPVLVNGGVLIAGIALLAWALFHWQGGWNLAVDENDALVAATRAVGFPVGHASEQLGWRGIRRTGWEASANKSSKCVVGWSNRRRHR